MKKMRCKIKLEITCIKKKKHKLQRLHLDFLNSQNIFKSFFLLNCFLKYLFIWLYWVLVVAYGILIP